MNFIASAHSLRHGGGRIGLLAALAGLLSACGGDGSSPPPAPPPPANRAPAFTSATSASIVENSAGTIYQAAASDADADALTYSIAGGADAARFSITAGGALAFASPPNFDLAADADGDNVYVVQIAASDGKSSTSLAVSITVTNSKEGVSVRRIASGLVAPVAIAPVSATSALVAEKGGAVYQLDLTTGAKTLLVRIDNVGGSGVLAITPLRDFATSGGFFAMYTTSGGFLVVNRFLRNPAGPTVPDNFGPALTIEAPRYAGGGWLGADTDGTYLAAIGDAVGDGDPDGSAQNDGSFLGKLIRITPNPDPFAGASPSFFLVSRIAKGLRQPNGGSLFMGGLLLADRGQSVAEEINFRPAGAELRNFGWPFKEGTRTVRGAPPVNVVDPVIEYPRGTGPRSGDGVVGGAIGPSAIASLREQYVFGDRSGAIFTVAASGIRAGSTLGPAAIERRDADFAPNQGSIDRPAAITAGTDGTLYIVDEDGEVFRVDAG